MAQSENTAQSTSYLLNKNEGKECCDTAMTITTKPAQMHNKEDDTQVCLTIDSALINRPSIQPLLGPDFHAVAMRCSGNMTSQAPAVPHHIPSRDHLVVGVVTVCGTILFTITALFMLHNVSFSKYVEEQEGIFFILLFTAFVIFFKFDFNNNKQKVQLYLFRNCVFIYFCSIYF